MRQPKAAPTSRCPATARGRAPPAGTDPAPRAAALTEQRHLPSRPRPSRRRDARRARCGRRGRKERGGRGRWAVSLGPSRRSRAALAETRASSSLLRSTSTAANSERAKRSLKHGPSPPSHGLHPSPRGSPVASCRGRKPSGTPGAGQRPPGGAAAGAVRRVSRPRCSSSAAPPGLTPPRPTAPPRRGAPPSWAPSPPGKPAAHCVAAPGPAKGSGPRGAPAEGGGAA